MRKLVLLILVSVLAGCARRNQPYGVLNHLEKAEQAYQAGDFDSAAENYQALLEAHPGYSYAHFKLGNILLRQNNAEQAVHHYESAIQNYPRDPRYWTNLALARLKLTHLTLAQAIDTFKDKPEQVAELITLEAQLAGLQEQ